MFGRGKRKYNRAAGDRDFEYIQMDDFEFRAVSCMLPWSEYARLAALRDHFRSTYLQIEALTTASTN